ncbi:hypothetical protein XENTR_v10022568 [Xenopus tropicalis]|nr:hypothetical protein XENTR_v10022568 [Xenopus tropicalis]
MWRKLRRQKSYCWGRKRKHNSAESLSAEDIQIHHKINDKEKCSLTLYCNGTGSFWENREADGIMGNNTLHVIYANASSNYTCTAQNQISRVSRSIIPCTLCREESRPETQHIRTTIAVSVPCFFIIPAIIALYLWVRHGHQLDPDTAREEPIIYDEVEMDKKEPFQSTTETVYVLLAADCPNEAEETAPQE